MLKEITDHTERHTTLAVHFTDTHPKAADFWLVWLYWADFFHASESKAARHEQKQARKALQLIAMSAPTAFSLPLGYILLWPNTWQPIVTVWKKASHSCFCVRVLILASDVTVVWKRLLATPWAGLHEESCLATQPTPSSPLLLRAVQAWRWRVNQVPEEHGSQLFPPLSLRSS